MSAQCSSSVSCRQPSCSSVYIHPKMASALASSLECRPCLHPTSQFRLESTEFTKQRGVMGRTRVLSLTSSLQFFEGRRLLRCRLSLASEQECEIASITSRFEGAEKKERPVPRAQGALFTGRSHQNHGDFGATRKSLRGAKVYGPK